MEFHTRNPKIHTKTHRIHTFFISPSFSSLPLLFLFSTVFSSQMRANLVLNQLSHLRPCLAKTRKPIFGLFSHFCYLALSLFINLHLTYTYYTLASHLFTNSKIAYQLIDLYHLCPRVVNDHFTLISNIHFGSLILFPKNSI